MTDFVDRRCGFIFCFILFPIKIVVPKGFILIYLFTVALSGKYCYSMIFENGLDSVP